VCNLGVGVDVEAMATVYHPYRRCSSVEFGRSAESVVDSRGAWSRDRHVALCDLPVSASSLYKLANSLLLYQEKENILPRFNKISTQDQRAMLVGPNLLCHLRFIVSIKI
jgi:hypothetical protein